MQVSRKPYLATIAAVALLLLSLGAAHCQLWGNTYQFYPAPGHYNGKTVWYLMTDASNQAFAQTLKLKTGFNVNYTPILANALAPALRVFNDDPMHPNKVMEFMPSIYHVTNAPVGLLSAQKLIFSAEWPVPSQVSGVITAIDSVNGTITLNGPGCGLVRLKMATFTFDPHTIFTKDGVVVPPGAICPCVYAVALIARNAQGIPVALRLDVTTAPTPVQPPLQVTPPGAYTPLWRLKLVTWNVPANAVVLKSEADVLNRIGLGANQLQVVDAATVVGASILVNSLGQKIPQATALNYGGSILVRLPVRAVYANGTVWKIVQLDFSDVGQATTFKGNYAPWLKRFSQAKVMVPPVPPIFQPIYTFWNPTNLAQLWVVSQVPAPFGPANTNALYSPVMNDWVVRSTGPTVYKSAAQILAAVGITKYSTGYVVFEPVVGK